jgi:pimeloyl-ACP methyl ester carboxylesterase
MQQQIGFCSTADGARIAYATVGTGPAVVVAWYAASHLGLEWEEPRVRNFWEAIGLHHMVVRYDKHGCGLSERNRTDFSLDFEVRTIEAIVKELRLKSLVLWGHGAQGTAAAVNYAVKSPDRVSRLILSNAQARWHPTLNWGGANQDSFRGLTLSNWRMASMALAEGMLGCAFNDALTVQWYLRIMQEGVAPETGDQLMLAQVYNMDVRDLLPKVSVPTLIVHYRNNRVIPFEAGLEVAAGIPGARFVPLEGDANLFFFNDTRPLRRAIAEFLGDPIEEARARSSL